MSALGNIRVVLVRTFHPGNIGSVARAMKTMGLSDLCLVNPRDFPSDEAVKMAAGADDLVAQARVVESLEEAVADCVIVAATSVRPRGYELPCLEPRSAAALLVDHAEKAKVALVFGPERMGLHNDDLRHARYRIEIPANPDYPSLNLASAAQIICYEVFRASADLNPTAKVKDLPSSESLEQLHAHLEQVLRDIQFLRPHVGETLDRLRNFIHRAEPEVIDVNIIRGILSAVERSRSE